MKFFKKISRKKWIRAICIMLVCVTAFGVFGGIAASVTNDTKNISPAVFSRGGLDDKGEYVATKKTLYTKEAFECKGLRIEPEFESNVSFDVYYYDFSGTFLTVEKNINKLYDVDSPFAKMCRIVIHPSIPEGVKEKDFEIGLLEVYGIAKSLKITVDKNQDYLYSASINYYDEKTVTTGKKLELANSEDSAGNIYISANTVTDATMKVTEKILVDNRFEKYDIFVRSKENSASHTVAVMASSNNVVKYIANFDLSSSRIDEWCKLTLEVVDFEEADYIMVSLPVDAECFIYGYN